MEKPKRVVNTLRTQFLAPYKPGNMGALVNINTLDYSKPQSGIYFIKSDSTNEIVYVGYSASSLYKTITRHFQTWTDRNRAEKTRFIYPKFGYKVKIIFTNPSNAAILEKYFIQKLRPRDNSFKYDYYLTQQEQLKCKIMESEKNFLSNAPTDTPF